MLVGTKDSTHPQNNYSTSCASMMWSYSTHYTLLHHDGSHSSTEQLQHQLCQHDVVIQHSLYPVAPWRISFVHRTTTAPVVPAWCGHTALTVPCCTMKDLIHPQDNYSTSCANMMWPCRTHHTLSRGQNREEWVMVLLNVNVQQIGWRKHSVAGLTCVAVNTVVVVFVAASRQTPVMLCTKVQKQQQSWLGPD